MNEIVPPDDPSGMTRWHSPTTGEAKHVAEVIATGGAALTALAADIEGPVRKPRTGSTTARRTGTLVVRTHPSLLAEVDSLAGRNNWTRADTVRSLLRIGMETEAKR